MAKIKGKWRWNDDVDTLPDSIYDLTSDVHFSSNGEEFSKLKVEKYAIPLHVVIYYDSIMVQRCLMNDPDDENSDGDFEIDEFLNETYRVMDFGETEQEISEELYEFIRANASEVSPISEKLVEVANNVPKVFEAGKQQGHGEGYDDGFEAGLEEGRELGGYNEGFEAGRTEGYNHGYDDGSQDGYNQGHKDGKKAEYDTFWDTFQNYGSESGMSYNEVFGKDRFTDVNYNPKYPIQVVVGINSGYAMFNGAGKITDIKVPIYHRGTNLGYLFSSCRMLKRIPALHILAEVTNFQAAFDGCVALEDITITGTIGENIDFKACTKLTQTSITSIVNALSDSAVGKTLTLSKAAVDREFAFYFVVGNTSEEIPGTHPDNPYWWPLRNTKSNWEIAYV